MERKIVLLNALPLNAFFDTGEKTNCVSVWKSNISELKEAIEGAEVECYIRHPATVKVLEEALGVKLTPQNKLYRYKAGDMVFIVTLRKPVRGQETENITVDDLIIAVAVPEVRWG